MFTTAIFGFSVSSSLLSEEVSPIISAGKNDVRIKVATTSIVLIINALFLITEIYSKPRIVLKALFLLVFIFCPPYIQQKYHLRSAV